MFTEDKITEIFFMADEFYKVFCRLLDKYSLNATESTGKRRYHRAGRLSVPEIMTIMILFHNSGYRCLKHFYLNEVCVNLRHLFPQVVSYNRFVELEKEAAIPLTIFIKKVSEFGISRLKEHKLFIILNIVSFQSLRFVVKEAICSQCCDHIHDEVVDRPVP